MIEGNPDAEGLIIRHIEKTGYEVIYERVDNPKALFECLENKTWDIILSDFNMPLMNAFESLEIIKKAGHDIPFILISGMIGEEDVVAAMKAGVCDFIRKDNLFRLVPAIERGITDSKTRFIAKQAEIKLKEQAKSLEKQAERDMLLRRITEAVKGSLDVNEIMDLVCKEVSGIFNVQRVVITDFKRNNEGNFKIAHYNTDNDIKDTSDLPPAAQGKIFEFALNFIEKNKNLVINNALEYDAPEYYIKIGHKLGIKSILGIPVKYKDKAWGAIFITDYITYRYWTDEEITLIETIASQIAIAIRQAELYAETKKQAERERLIREITEAVRISLDPEEVQNKLVTMVAKTFNPDKCFIRPFDDELDTFTPVKEYAEYYASPYPNKLYGFSNEVEKYIKTEYKQGNYFAISDFEELLGKPEPFHSGAKKHIEHYGILANYSFPIIYDNKFVGAFALQFKKKTYLATEDIDLLRTIVSHAAITLKQAELYSQAQQASKAKSEFLANMSHELRTPLNAIIGFIDMIKSGNYGELSGKISRYLDNVSYSSDLLLSLVNDVLDISKVEAEKIELKYENIRSKTLIYEVATVIQPLADKKNIKIDLQLQDIAIKADSKRFIQIINNLLSNAVKFTPKGGKVTVKTELIKNKLVTIVEDTGIGIAKEDFYKIFKHFSQIDSSVARQYEGTGLGLALSKKLVELHRGNIYFESKVGKGSRFIFELPVNPEISPKTTVLIIEDNVINMDLAKEVLEQANFRVIEAEDAITGIPMVIQYQPDIVLMDLHLPIKSGYDACKELKFNPETRHIPVVAFTAMVMEQDKKKAYEHGCDGIISKPIDIRTLAVTVESYIKKNSLKEQLLL
jgi:signal transduction histidine kinase/DNA-binding response OmpR family regulator